LLPGVCHQCISDRRKSNRKGKPCDDGICSLTGREVDDPVYGMQVPNDVYFIAQMWLDIISISGKEKREKEESGKHYVYHLYTLQHIKTYLDMQNWSLINMSKQECFYLITLFHKHYMSTVL